MEDKSAITIMPLTKDDYDEYDELLKQEIGINLLPREPGGIYVLTKDKEIVSTGRLLMCDVTENPFGFIENVLTKGQHRRNGYGKKVVQHLCSVAISRGATNVFLGCEDHLQPFYQASGFVRTGVMMALESKVLLDASKNSWQDAGSISVEMVGAQFEDGSPQGGAIEAP